MPVQSILEFAHALVAQALLPGDVAIDATVGNGHDTLFLAQQVGEEGRVVGFDVQATAIENTRQRVQREAPNTPLQLVQAGHEAMINHLDDRIVGTVGAVMFNLGYLPAGDHSVTTLPETTRTALDASLQVIRKGGVVTVVMYTGHEGGEEEAKTVKSWASALPQKRFRALSYSFVNQVNDPPQLLAVEKEEGGEG